MSSLLCNILLGVVDRTIASNIKQGSIFSDPPLCVQHPSSLQPLIPAQLSAESQRVVALDVSFSQSNLSTQHKQRHARPSDNDEATARSKHQKRTKRAKKKKSKTKDNASLGETPLIRTETVLLTSTDPRTPVPRHVPVAGTNLPSPRQQLPPWRWNKRRAAALDACTRASLFCSCPSA